MTMIAKLPVDNCYQIFDYLSGPDLFEIFFVNQFFRPITQPKNSKLIDSFWNNRTRLYMESAPKGSHVKLINVTNLSNSVHFLLV